METNLGDLRDYLGRNWGWIVLRGVVAVLFGVLTLATPGITLAVLVMMWGGYAIADGVLAMIAGWQLREGGKPLWSLLVVGVLGIAAGVLTFKWPGLTALALLMLIAAWAIGTGVFQIAAAVSLRKAIAGEWALGLSGVLSVAFGVLMMLRPGAGALAVVWMIGANAISIGIFLLVLGFRVRAVTHRKLVHA